MKVLTCVIEGEECLVILLHHASSYVHKSLNIIDRYQRYKHLQL